ncbi:MAG TPA: hypothetical protein VKJ07_21485, partial [Mycobacteriales bacterium]|nr:hypothetical protein [Mycobacteriales bacterium]
MEVGHSIGVSEGREDVAELVARVQAGDVVTEVGEQRRAARVEREGGVHDRRQILILDLHQLTAVLGDIAGLGDNDRHGIPDEAHLVGRQQGE